MVSIKERLILYLIFVILGIFVVTSAFSYYFYYDLHWLQTIEEAILFVGVGATAVTIILQLGFRLISETIDRYETSTEQILAQLKSHIVSIKDFLTRMQHYSKLIDAIEQQMHDIVRERDTLITHETFLATKLYPQKPINEIPATLELVKQFNRLATKIIHNWTDLYRNLNPPSAKVPPNTGQILDLIIRTTYTSQYDLLSERSDSLDLLPITTKFREENINEIREIQHLREHCMQKLAALENNIENFLQAN